MRPITNSQLDFMNLIWDNAPVGSTRLVELAAEAFGWKKSTTYTVLKKLKNKGLVDNENAVVTPLVGREQIAQERGQALLHKLWGGSRKLMLASFLEQEPLTREEAMELKAMIDQNTWKGEE